jgi:hypothetical protein
MRRHRNQDGFAVVTDSVVLSADTKLCPNKAAQGPRVPKHRRHEVISLRHLQTACGTANAHRCEQATDMF